MDLYTRLLKPLLFLLPPEPAHHLALAGLRFTPRPLLRWSFGPMPADPVRLFGLDFPNRVGLGAGMDKDARALTAWEALGFGFIEAGTVTALPQPGNPKPRCFRHPEKNALVNRMGFNNAGADAIARRLARLKASGHWPRVPVGINIGKSKVTPNSEAVSDYVSTFKLLQPYGDYFTINVSSPNTPELRALQAVESLTRIIRAVRLVDGGKPVLVKISPDLEDPQIAEIADVADREGLAGIIATNTTLDHKALAAAASQAGGLSGAPLSDRATQVVEILRRHTRLPIVASGGVMGPTDARRKIEAGADLVQIYTGFVYSGPAIIRSISAELSRLKATHAKKSQIHLP
jgi:dihydroorotate dehydrogenase